MTKFKIGDKVSFLGKRDHIPEYVCENVVDSSLIKHGSTWWNNLPAEVVGLDNGYVIVRYSYQDQTMQLGFSPDKLVLVSKGKSKETPIIKHVVIQDSCGNFLGIKNSEKEAIVFAKSYNKENITIYKMVEVAKVTTERRVSKVKTSKKNGRSK
jgi:hypothetical protein